MNRDPLIRAHQEWLGFLQPVGLVVSPHALVAAQAQLPKSPIREHQAFLEATRRPAKDPRDEPVHVIDDFPAFAIRVLGWQPTDLAGGPGGPPLPANLEVHLPELNVSLRPTYAVPDADPKAAGKFLLLIGVEAAGTDLDALPADDGRSWRASATARFERLLRDSGTPIGLLVNEGVLRLVYAPRGESSGHITFPLEVMSGVAGRPVLAALLLLLGPDRLFTLPEKQRLPEILRQSRRYQNEVSTALADQVLDALHELLRGFQSAHDASRQQLLADVLREEPGEVYGGLLTTLLRLVFLLYAEDRGLMPQAEAYQRYYAVAGLFERLREDHARHPDTMDLRYGAWAQLLTLFRLVHDGAASGAFRLPARHGRLFQPDAYPFLEGRPRGSARSTQARLDPPKVPDGVVYRVLDKLLMLDGDRLSYRALDVEQIGSVYEAMMGFTLGIARGPSVAVRPHHVVVRLDDLLEEKPAERAKRLKEAACELTGKSLDALKAATTLEELRTAFGKRLSPRTPQTLPAGAMYLQPTEERRRSGSHYTPRSLTEPIVRTTFRPVLEALGPNPRPEKLLDLKVCDPAMGSGAFLVEACRFLADRLIESWAAHGVKNDVPPDEDLPTYARRIVAQRCLYGVDKNPFAVDLAKLSLWLATLARDHPFTFLDHALRHGDSLVGLTRAQIAGFHWDPAPRVTLPTVQAEVKKALEIASARRTAIQALAASDDSAGKRTLLREADEAIDKVRLVGDVVIAAFFGTEKPKAREEARKALAVKAADWLQRGDLAVAGEFRALAEGLRERMRPLPPFHWEVEYPEVFGREAAGFNVLIGNPPFAYKNTLISSQGEGYLPWLQTVHEFSHGNADLVAHFFRRAFGVLAALGALGLIATKTISQGDTRATGLRWICGSGGRIYEARRRMKWVGSAAVTVSVVHILRSLSPGVCTLDGRSVPRITAFLFDRGEDDDPKHLLSNADTAFIGTNVLGSGFMFDDDEPQANSINEMKLLIEKNHKNGSHIFPFAGGEEVNDTPTPAPRRYVISFGEAPESEAKQFPDLYSLLEAKAKGTRAAHSRRPWWQHERPRSELYSLIRGKTRVLVCSSISKFSTFAWYPSTFIFSHNLVVFTLNRDCDFAVLQSRVHEVYAGGLSSGLEDRFGYRPSDCFETFPFPPNWGGNPGLHAIGNEYERCRSQLMIENNHGLTATYNRFHDPDERDPKIQRLRDLHAAMDRAVLDAYGWTDIQPTCEFLLDYEEDETEGDAEGEGTRRKRKKPWRLRWPDDVRDEVLARLLALNEERAKEEALAGEGLAEVPSQKVSSSTSEGDEEPPTKVPKRLAARKKPASAGKAEAKRKESRAPDGPGLFG